MTQKVHLELSIPPEWPRVDQVREAVEKTLLATFGASGLEETLPMVSAELLENAIKYGMPGAEVNLSLKSESRHFVVTVTNAVSDESRHARSLRERLEWLDSFDDAADAYTAAMQEVYASAGESPLEDSGLGLARVAYEGQCRVACELSVPHRVAVTARFDTGVSASGV